MVAPERVGKEIMAAKAPVPLVAAAAAVAVQVQLAPMPPLTHPALVVRELLPPLLGLL